MIVYPLSTFETCAVRWTARAMNVLATAVLVLLGAMSIAATGS